MNKELEKILKNNPLGFGPIQFNMMDSIEFINNNVSINAQENLFNLFQHALKNAEPEVVAQAIKTYSEIEGNTYAEAVHNLIQNATNRQPTFNLEDGVMYRPLSFKENMIAIINSKVYYDLDSCTGVALKANSPLIKINPISKELITISKDIAGQYIFVDYDNFEGEEINKRNTSYEEIWLIAMGGINSENKEIYNDYNNFVSKKTGYTLLKFYSGDIPTQDQLRPVSIRFTDVGGFLQNRNSHLLRVN